MQDETYKDKIRASFPMNMETHMFEQTPSTVIKKENLEQIEIHGSPHS